MTHPRNKYWTLWSVLFVVLILIAAACGNDNDAVTDPDAQSSMVAANTAAADALSMMPGEGVSVSMARATWSEGYVQAAIYRALLQELGYEVSDPATQMLVPAVFYPALGEGQFDLWVNGWFPLHEALIENAGLSDVVRPIGSQISAGVLQGFLIDKATAEANDITTLDDIGDNLDIAALFDTDDNGKANLMGCDYGWGCHDLINDIIAHNGWGDTIEHVSATHAALFAASLGRYQRGEPILQYVWTPATFTAKLVPGEDVIWLSMNNPLPDEVGVVDLPAEQCPAQPCQLGFLSADIRVVARNDFLAANPAAAKLLELVKIPAVDVLLFALDYEGGASSEADVREAADRWIAANRAAIDGWLNEARSVS